MGTNYYGRIIPTKKRKAELINSIVENDFREIRKKVDELYGHFSVDWDGEITGGEIHLGKRSGGWKFLWNPNIYIIRHGHTEWIDNGDGSKYGKWITEPDTYYYVYPLTKKGIWNFIKRKDVEIYDEYNEKQDKKEFFDMAVNWTTWNGEEAWDSKSYNEFERERNPNWRSYSCSGEYTNMLEKEGFTFISEDKSDFYSDGLRFSTNTEFS